MSEPCITCGGPVGEMLPELRRAKERFGLPIRPAKRCPDCVWSSLLKFAASEDEDEVPDEKGGDGR